MMSNSTRQEQRTACIGDAAVRTAGRRGGVNCPPACPAAAFTPPFGDRALMRPRGRETSGAVPRTLRGEGGTAPRARALFLPDYERNGTSGRPSHGSDSDRGRRHCLLAAGRSFSPASASAPADATQDPLHSSPLRPAAPARPGLAWPGPARPVPPQTRRRDHRSPPMLPPPKKKKKKRKILRTARPAARARHATPDRPSGPARPSRIQPESRRASFPGTGPPRRRNKEPWRSLPPLSATGSAPRPVRVAGEDYWAAEPARPPVSSARGARARCAALRRPRRRAL